MPEVLQQLADACRPQMAVPQQALQGILNAELTIPSVLHVLTGERKQKVVLPVDFGEVVGNGGGVAGWLAGKNDELLVNLQPSSNQ